MKSFMFVLVLCLLMVGCSGQQAQHAEIQAAEFDHQYQMYGSVLGMYVVGGRVDYDRLQDQRATLDSVVQQFANVDLSDTSEPRQLAFYLNAYNAITLRSIIDAYPVESIQKINGVWDKKKWDVAGNKLTLNDIEHEILRKEFAEPRIHIAINCASIGCPPLLNEPFLADSLGQQLEAVSQAFTSARAHNRLDPAAGEAKLSAIFDWFGEDFIDHYYDESRWNNLAKKENAALHFLIANSRADVQDSLRQGAYTVSYLEYDWSLNERK